MLSEMIRAYLAGTLTGEELVEAKKKIQASPALRAIVEAEKREQEGTYKPLPGLDPFLIMRYVTDTASLTGTIEVNRVIDEEYRDSGSSQTFDEIQLMKDLIREGHINGAKLREDFLAQK